MNKKPRHVRCGLCGESVLLPYDEYKQVMYIGCFICNNCRIRDKNTLGFDLHPFHEIPTEKNSHKG